MNQDAIRDAYKLFAENGYKGDINQFYDLLNENEEAVNDAHSIFAKNGYKGDVNQFSGLLGLNREPEDKGFIEDIVQTYRQSKAVGGTVNEAFDLYKLGKDISDDQLDAVIKAREQMINAGQVQTNEAFNFQKDQKENGGGIYGTLKALYDNPGFIPQFLVGSAVTMASSLESEEVAGTAAAAAGAGAATGAAIGSTGFAFGPLGAVTTAVGAKKGAVSGAIGGLVGAMETGLTLNDLLDLELRKKAQKLAIEENQGQSNLLKEVLERNPQYTKKYYENFGGAFGGIKPDKASWKKYDDDMELIGKLQDKALIDKDLQVQLGIREGELNKDLLEIQKRKRDLEPKKTSSDINVDKAVFVGSTNDLVKMLKGKRDAK